LRKRKITAKRPADPVRRPDPKPDPRRDLGDDTAATSRWGFIGLRVVYT
jgi:hypothetical protein